MVANEVNKAQKLKKVKDEQKAQAAANAANGGTSAKLGEKMSCVLLYCVGALCVMEGGEVIYLT